MDLFITGLDFTKQPELFKNIQNINLDKLMGFQIKLTRLFSFPCVLILTCDRAEVLSEFKPINYETLEHVLGLKSLLVKPYRYSYENKEALLHVFLLSAGIISPLFGEDTIISQLTDSEISSRLTGSASSRISKLLNMAVAFGKEMQSDDSLFKIDSSIIDEVVRLVGKNKNVLVVGSGTKARLIGEKLAEVGNRVKITLRDEKKVFLVPVKCEGVKYEDRYKYIESSSVIISASSGLYHTFKEEDRDLFDPSKLLFDLAVPHDIPDILEPIRLEYVESPERDKTVLKVKALAEKRIKAFLDWNNAHESYPGLSREAEDFSLKVIQKLNSTLKELNICKEKENALRLSLYETIRKTYINQNLSEKK